MSTRGADTRLKEESTSFDPFDDYMASVHGSHFSVTNNSSRERGAMEIVL